MKWNQKTIHQWGIDTFGPPALNTLGLAIRMAKEGVELAFQLRQEDEKEVKDESADVAIVTLQVANCLSFNVAEILDMEADEHNPQLSDQVLKFQAIYSAEDGELEDSGHCADMLNQYVVDLISGLFHGKPDNAKETIVKIFAVLAVIEELYDFDLNEEIQRKMEVNAARQWAQKADGSFQHV